MPEVLELFKLDIGIKNTIKDSYFTTVIESCKNELIRKGIVLDLTNAEDVMLLSDYSTWRYRKRQEDLPLPNFIQTRIRDRTIKKRSGYIG